MSVAQYHLPEIPEGLQIYEERLEVAGLQYRRDDALAFVKGQNISLEFEREQNNIHYHNAIKIIGCRHDYSSTTRYFIGYVPRYVATDIVEGCYFEKVAPRLLKTYVGENGFVEILFQVLGPKGERHKYKRIDPESLPLKLLGEELHYSAYVNLVKYLKQEKRYDEAVTLLLKLVNETEKEAKRDKCGVAPWYYEQLAIIYSKLMRPVDELKILERYVALTKAPRLEPDKLVERLYKVRNKLRTARRAD